MTVLEEPGSLREQVSVAVRSALVAGQMNPGQVYSVPTLRHALRSVGHPCPGSFARPDEGGITRTCTQ